MIMGKNDGDGCAEEEKEMKTVVEVGQHQALLDREGMIG